VAFVADEQRAWKSPRKRSNLAKFYFNLATIDKAAAKKHTPSPAPVNLYFALEQPGDDAGRRALKAIFWPPCAATAALRRRVMKDRSGAHMPPTATAALDYLPCTGGIDAKILRKP